MRFKIFIYIIEYKRYLKAKFVLKESVAFCSHVRYSMMQHFFRYSLRTSFAG
jgi:hypothetical protein